MNTYLIIVLVLLVGSTGIDVLLDCLSLGKLNSKSQLELPTEFQGVYEADKYKNALLYQGTNCRFSLVAAAIETPIVIAFILLGAFNIIDVWARSFGFGSIITGLIFVGVLAILRMLLSLPFSIYKTFVIEEKFGFNKTTAKTFVVDMIKGLASGLRRIDFRGRRLVFPGDRPDGLALRLGRFHGCATRSRLSCASGISPAL
jgi:STE24 endopeptidase